MGYTKFHDNTIESKFIKELVSKTNVPFISTWKPGDFAIRGMVYITKDAIWKCQHTGHPSSVSDKFTVKAYDKYNNLKDISGNYFIKLQPYIFGQEYFNITGHYTSNVLGYDGTTHFYLGMYLRMMRDLFDLDMMPFYNCFCGDYLTNLNFNYNSSDNSVEFTTVSNDAYKILSVPVRFGQTYLIATDSDIPVDVVTVVYGANGIIEDKTALLNQSSGIEDLPFVGSDEDIIYTEGITYKRYNKMVFTSPVIYKTKTWEQIYNTYVASISNVEVTNLPTGTIRNTDFIDTTLGQFERNLRLLIKVPKSQKTSLVVIEGDYIISDYIDANTNNVTFTNQTQSSMTVNTKSVTGKLIRPQVIKNNENHDWVKVEPTLLSSLGLLQMSDGESYAFSDRLIEYLLQNVINPLDTFTQDIQRVQEYSKSNINAALNGSKFNGEMSPGVWSDELREYLYNLTMNSRVLTRKIDITGYVDKDVETVITRGQGV